MVSISFYLRFFATILLLSVTEISAHSNITFTLLKSEVVIL